ncbi:AAA family ATPase [Parvibaculum sp.]|uniref:AAA family ATPase n=1 Tax=Parvibaculum sp. TaxID=2024848 RepID=UPI003299B84C
MDTQAKQKFSISARYLGPVFSLDGEVTKHDQNLIFARNGTGKSFLSRAFRYLDLHSDDREIDEAAGCLVSDESPDGKGEFTFRRGTQILGSLRLEKNEAVATASVSDAIFHVFSEDFVQEELREKRYTLDGDIENQIAVDSENIKLDEAKKALLKAQTDERQAAKELQDDYEKKKVSELHEKAGINKRLTEYRNLDLEALVVRFPEKPGLPERSFAEILKDLDRLKSLPSEPDYPEAVGSLSTNDVDIEAIRKALQKVTSPSSVSETIKQKIETHHNFYETGLKIIHDEGRSTCPFCEQGIGVPDAKVIIDTYVEYFSNEEEKHKSELRAFYKGLKTKEDEVSHLETRISRQIARYDALKHYIPSKKETTLETGEQELAKTRETITAYKRVIEEKAKALATAFDLPDNDLASCAEALTKIINENNQKAAALASAVGKTDDERKGLQRAACQVFDVEFAIEHWKDIEALKALQEIVKEKALELAALEKESPSTEARARVADTFEILLRDFFADKYVFDRDTFVLKRGTHEMTRGPHRTLSDGEKTAIAFCYFVACTHRKVESAGDYKKLFLVFDDPVTSMSYDYVFAIAQTLKNLSISAQGEISINPGLIANNQCARPEILILTHSSYFFNLSIANRVVKEDAAFALHTDKLEHKISRLDKYVAPFQHQLRDVCEVADGKDPDHGTGNAVRSVLEAVGRFCRPDKTKSLTDFITFLAGDGGFTLKSVLINNLCHGTYYDETPSPDDLRLACQETLQVVEKYAEGQLELVRNAA